MKNNNVIGILIVLAVVVFLVFLTVGGKKDGASLRDTSNVNTDIFMEQEPNSIDSSKLKITVEKEGTGEVAKTGDFLAVNYTGRLADGTVFDSNVLSEFGHVEPFVLQLGAGMVIKGWDAGLIGMKQGEKRTLQIAPEYAYGESGAGSAIPPNATLIFEVELISIINNSY